MTDFLGMTQEAYESSSAYLDANYRQDWDYSLRAFRNEHAVGSKYLSDEFKARSRLFRPKTRSIIRKNEAAAAVALFSNMEVVNVTPGNPDDPVSLAGAACVKELLEYRLSKTIPAFPLVMGAIQDAQTTGAVISYQYWEYEVRNGRKVKDKPCIELRPIENIRLDGGAHWLDPVNTSPYFCDIIPMYVCDVKRMMDSKDDKTGQPKWKKLKDEVILKARPDVMEVNRQLRLGSKQNPDEERPQLKHFDIVWVMRWFMKDEMGDDYTYYSLGTEELLTKPMPVEEVYFHGKRPYVMGCAIIETHKPFKTGIPVLVRPLQQETNQLQNSRLDNVQFVLNKRWLVARGRQVDVQSLVRNVPGGVTLVTNPKEDVQESNWPDVTSSAYVEQDRINADLDELAGNFSPSTKVANNAVNDTLGGSQMASMGAGLMTDYLIRTVIETWWEPVLRQLVLLEQYYETDEIVLGVCAQKARLFPRFGFSQITDHLLMQEVNVNVNVGMGSSNPQERMQKFLMATNAAMAVVAQAPPGFNAIEAVKEIYSNAGYRDGARFFSEQQDPRLLKAFQMVQQLTQHIQTEQAKQQAVAAIEQAKLSSNERVKAAELKMDYFRIDGDLKIRQAEIEVAKAELALEAAKAQIEVRGASEEMQLKLIEANKKLEAEEAKLQLVREKAEAEREKVYADLIQTRMELEAKAQETNARSQQSAMQLETADLKLRAAKEESKAAPKIEDMHKRMEKQEMSQAQMGQALSLILGGMSQKKKPTGFTLKKNGKQTQAIRVTYDDGSEEELPVKAA